MRLEPIDEKSLAACARLFVDVFNSAPWNESWEVANVELRLTEFFHSVGFVGVLAVEDDQLLGFVLGNSEQWDKSRHFNLREMCVATKKQRHGIGKSLISALQTRLEEEAIDRIYLLTARDSPAQSFYEKCGFYLSPRMVMMVKRSPDNLA